jgi:hypothetical protein
MTSVEQQARNRRFVLQRETRDLRRIEDALFQLSPYSPVPAM